MNRQEEVTKAALRDGLISGLCGIIPTGLGVWYLSNYSKKFIQLTSYSTRTALVIMPPLFMFGLASEKTVNSSVRESQNRQQHAKEINQWADENSNIDAAAGIRNTEEKASLEEKQTRLSSLYAKSVQDSGIRIVKGDRLGPHHIVANFWQENPFKVLLGIGAPTIGAIFMHQQKTSKTALQMQLMHTRVIGQSSMIIFLLSIMGFKEYMDSNGKFITQGEADRMVMEMQRTREELFERLGVSNPDAGPESPAVKVDKPISSTFEVNREGKVVRVGKEDKSNATAVKSD